MYLSYVGIRVMDLERSLKFYTDFFGLKEVARGDARGLGAGIYVLLRDEFSGMKLELNWYPKSSRFATTYVPGEGLDHVAFKVEEVQQTIQRLRARGVKVVKVDRKITNPPGAPYKVAFVEDPDGNWIELYENVQGIGKKVPLRY